MPQKRVDHFGLLPEPAKSPPDSHRLRLLAKLLGVSMVGALSKAIVKGIQFCSQDEDAMTSDTASRSWFDKLTTNGIVMRVSDSTPRFPDPPERLRKHVPWRCNVQSVA